MSAKKAVLWFMFITCPSVILTGYIVYKFKNLLLANGVLIDNAIYWMVLFFAMWIAMLISSKRIIKEMHVRNKNKKLD